MLQNIDPELLKRLDAVAQKLGVGAEYVWKILVKQAYADAWSWAPYILVWIFGASFAYYFARKCQQRWKADKYEDGWIVGVFACGAACTGFVIGLMSCISGLMQILLNPEGYALRELLSGLK